MQRVDLTVHLPVLYRSQSGAHSASLALHRWHGGMLDAQVIGAEGVGLCFNATMTYADPCYAKWACVLPHQQKPKELAKCRRPRHIQRELRQLATQTHAGLRTMFHDCDGSDI
eukprot:3595591-Amphidinium_carterae.1